MRQNLIALRLGLRQGFRATFGGNINPGEFSGGEALFWSLAIVQVLVYGALSAFYYMNESFSFFINFNSFFTCLMMVTSLPLIGFLLRHFFRAEESPYLLPSIFLVIHIPVLLIEALIWSWGQELSDGFSDRMKIWNEAVMFLLFMIVFRAFMMNMRSATPREQFRLALTAMVFVAVSTILPNKAEYGPYYIMGQYVNDGEETDHISDEYLFYIQSELLKKDYRKLLPSKPGKTDVYTITYGGYGYQQVFKREALFAQKQIDHALGSTGRSVVLANHRTTRRTLPLADITNLYSVSEEMARKAQTNEDVLVLYITSHGGQQGKISTDLPGTDLINVDAQNLHKMLKDSGFRWKVVIVSACYSGSFVPVMKDDDTLIITAASATRTSFGCADDADLTYFGEAFLKDALPSATGFEDAFTKTRKIIADREKAENITPSDPQISMGKNIRAKLARMRFNAD